MSDPLVIDPNNPPTLSPPEMLPELLTVPLKVCPLNRPMMPPSAVAFVSVIEPVFVKLFANVNEVVVVPKMPPIVLMAAVLVTASAFVSVLTLPEIAFEVRLPIKPPTLDVPEMLLVET